MPVDHRIMHRIINETLLDRSSRLTSKDGSLQRICRLDIGDVLNVPAPIRIVLFRITFNTFSDDLVAEP